MVTRRVSSRPFVFLDKDGTLVEDVPYSANPAVIQLAPGAGPALRLLRDAGFGLAVVSNQSGIARGLFTEADLAVYVASLEVRLAAEGVALDGFLHCPHHPDGTGRYAIACDCRKPAPGMLLRAAAELGADLARSWIVGDILDDVEAGHRAGCRAVLVDRGHETEWQRSELRRPDVTVRDLPSAADAIVGAGAVRGPGAMRDPRPVSRSIAARDPLDLTPAKSTSQPDPRPRDVRRLRSRDARSPEVTR